jgi:hypothetical protein
MPPLRPVTASSVYRTWPNRAYTAGNKNEGIPEAAAMPHDQNWIFRACGSQIAARSAAHGLKRPSEMQKTSNWPALKTEFAMTVRGDE